MKRGLLIGGGVFVVVVAAVVIFTYSSIDSLIKAAVEEIGSEVTGTKVTLREVEISPSTGEGALRGFTLGNPPGFNTASAARLGEIRVRLDIGSITGDTIVIREILISAPEITYELGSGGSNIDAIRSNVAAFTGGGAKAAPGGTETVAGEQGGRKLIIENLRIRGGKIKISATFLQGKTMTVPLPAIHLKDIGKDKGGAAPGEVVEKIMAEISRSAGSAVSPLGVGKAMDAVKKGAEDMKKALERGARGATDAIGKGARDIGGAIKGLFGK